VAPLVIGNSKNPIHAIDYFTLRVQTANMDHTLQQVEAILHQIDASHLFEYNFLDKKWELFYREDTKRQVIFMAIAGMTILIACLGLLGLVTFAAEQRTREIGIRKVLGAGIGNILALLSKDLLLLVLIASVIAFPLAGWAMQTWLQEFAYRIRISWWMFALAGGAVLLFAVITISFQAMKAAVSNPITALRSE
jgi:putative ABC transport system permease protein